jgi:hypothetical protein
LGCVSPAAEFSSIIRGQLTANAAFFVNRKFPVMCSGTVDSQTGYF